mmetsp:Transcript_44323/g.125513  ORF Transcript_44323/g.125513 Transcript_44323/m.125513 type:complete len:206 (-) Transcript_44323:845-1462(-)
MVRARWLRTLFDVLRRDFQSRTCEAAIASVASSLWTMASASVWLSRASASFSFSSLTSSCSFFTRLSLSTAVAACASSLMFFTVEAKRSVLKLSSKWARAGLKVPIIAVRELPLSAFESRSVSFEFRNFARLFVALVMDLRRPPVMELLRLIILAFASGFVPLPPRLWMQLASHMRLMLMQLNSLRRSPFACVVRSFSRPARSAK